MSKIFKKIVLSVLAAILLFGVLSFYKNSAKAAINYTFKTDGSYKWALEGGNLTNYVDVYDKTTNQKITTLKVYYKNNGNGTLSNYSSSAGGAQPFKSKIGDYTRYSVASTSDSKFAVPSQYVGNYHILAAPGTAQTYSNVFYTVKPTGPFSGYLFEATGGNMFLQASEPKSDDWYGVYLIDTMVSMKNGGQPVTPASGTTATGSTATEGCENASDCVMPPPPAPYQPKENEKSISETLKQSNITTAWSLSLDLVNVLAIFFLLIIAFANILHLDPETWNFKRLLPALIIGLICANLSHLFCRAMIDFAAMLMNFLIPKELAAQYVSSIYMGMFSGWNGWATGLTLGALVVAFLSNLGCAAVLIGLVILGIPVIITFILWFMLAGRVYVLWFLVILSPIAFFGMFFDPLKKIVGTWWNWFLMWVVIGPIAYFFIYLAEGFGRDPSLNGAGMTCFDPSNASQVGGFTKYLVVNILLVLAIYIPYSIGSKFGMALWMGLGKFMGGMGLYAGGGATTAGLRAAGRRLPGRPGKFLSGINNPFILPALPRGMENSPAGMLWQKKREADVNAKVAGWRESNPIIAALANNMIGEDLAKFDPTSYTAEQLINTLNEGVKTRNQKKMATGVWGLRQMAMDGRRPEEQQAAQLAMDELKIRPEDINSPYDTVKLADVAKGSGGLDVKDRNKKGKPTGYDVTDPYHPKRVQGVKARKSTYKGGENFNNPKIGKNFGEPPPPPPDKKDPNTTWTQGGGI